MAAKKPYNCGIGPAFEVVGGKWKALIVSELHEGTRRTGELRRRIGRVSEKMLIQQLRELERDGVIHREAFSQDPAARGVLTHRCRPRSEQGARSARRLGRETRVAAQAIDGRRGGGTKDMSIDDGAIDAPFVTIRHSSPQRRCASAPWGGHTCASCRRAVTGSDPATRLHCPSRACTQG